MAAPMKFQTRVVGWKNKQEFIDTYNCLYDKNASEQIDGLGRINAWKCRFAEKMPVAIECTATLLEATLMGGSENDPSRLQLIYSMAIIRFVNLMTGYLQNKAQAQPVVALAKEISLPEWLVELRHEASHKHIPPLAVLRLAAKTGLAWLRENFWEKQCRSETPSLLKVVEEVVYLPNINGVEGEIKRLSIMYQQARYKGGCRSDNADVAEIISNLEHCLTDPEAKYLIVSILLQDGYLVPTTEQLQALCIKEGISYNDSIICIHRGLCQFWKPLIMLLHSLGLTPLLLQYLIRELGRFKATKSKAADYLVGWAMEIIMAGNRKMYRPHLMLFRDSLQLPWNDLFGECVQNPNGFTLDLLQYILPNVTPKLSEQAQLKVRQLSSIYCNTLETQEPASTTDNSTVRIYTEEDILRTEGGNIDRSKLVDEQSDVVEEMDILDKGVTEGFVLKERDQFQPWSMSTAEVDWAKFPIGSLPGQPDDPNFLVLDVPQSINRSRLQHLKSHGSTPTHASKQQSTASAKKLKSSDTRHEADTETEVDFLTKSELENMKQMIHVF